MTSKQKTAFFFILGVLITAAVILMPWSEIFFSLGIDPFRLNVPASMEVNCLGGKCNVYLDGQKKGETPLEILDVAPGEHTIKLERVSNTEGFYTEITKKVRFLKATKVYTEWEIGPSEMFSQGHIVTFRERRHSTDPVLSIKSDQADIRVSIGGVFVGEVPFLGDEELLKEDSQKITLSKEGYLDREVEVEVNYNYITEVEVELMAIPVVLEN